MHGLVPAAGRDPSPMPIRHAQLAIPSTMTTTNNLDIRTPDRRKGILSAIPCFAAPPRCYALSIPMPLAIFNDFLSHFLRPLKRCSSGLEVVMCIGIWSSQNGYGLYRILLSAGVAGDDDDANAAADPTATDSAIDAAIVVVAFATPNHPTAFMPTTEAAAQPEGAAITKVLRTPIRSPN